MNYSNFKRKLYIYYSPGNDVNFYQQQLLEITRKSGESLQEFCGRVAMLAVKAYPFSSYEREENGVTAIIRGCNSDYVKQAALTNTFQARTIDDAVRLLVDMENRNKVFQVDRDLPTNYAEYGTSERCHDINSYFPISNEKNIWIHSLIEGVMAVGPLMVSQWTILIHAIKVVDLTILANATSVATIIILWKTVLRINLDHRLLRWFILTILDGISSQNPWHIWRAVNQRHDPACVHAGAIVTSFALHTDCDIITIRVDLLALVLSWGLGEVKAEATLRVPM